MSNIIETYLDGLIIIDIPDQVWVNRLRKGNHVWLVKEKNYASIEWEFEPPEPGHTTGRIAIRKLNNNTIPPFGGTETWFIRPNGQGIDYSQLFLPVMGHLEDNPKPIDEPEIRQLKRELGNLTARMDMLEKALWFNNTLSGKPAPYAFPRRKP